MTKKQRLTDLANQRILVLDGAMGTMIQRYKLEEADFRNEALKDHPSPLRGNNDLLSVTRPDVIREIHAQYYAAGSDIVETNSFSGTWIAQEDYKCEHMVYDINYWSAKIAREVADEFTAREPEKPRFVAGALGPTTKLSSMSPDVNDPGFRSINFDQLREAYQEQVKGLLDGGVDLLLIETITDTLNAKAALFAIEDELENRGLTTDDVPIMISGTITDASGRTLSGQTTEAFLVSVSHVPLFSIGLNCAMGARQMRPFLQVLSDRSDVLVSAYPNAGLPNHFGEYDESPAEMQNYIREFLDLNLVNILGGCCGTTPEHIRAIAEVAKEFEPRRILQGISVN
jgi:5-methyltetrahydrofolate--homocysteine methyltransferase